jgi:hypothetical protein
MMADLSYAFNGNTQGTPDAARKRQAVAQAMMGASQQMPQDIGQGLGALGNALMMRQQMRATQFPGAPPAPAGAAPQAFDFGNFMNKALGMNSGGGLY